MGHLQIPLQPRKLSFNEKGQLVDKLLDCPKVRDRHARDMIVQELSFAASIPRHEADKDDVRNILNTSLNYEGSLQELIDVIATFEKDELGRDSLPMQRLSEFLEVLFSSPESIAINVDLLGKLYKLTANIHVAKNELHTMYRRSVVDGRLPHKYQSIDEGETLPLMIQDLAQTWPQSTSSQNRLTHPLLTFIKHLSKCVSDAMVRETLLQWREKVAEEEHILLEEENTPSTVTDQSKASFYLLIKFEPKCDKQDEFYIHAWFMREQDGEKKCLTGYVKEEACTLDMMASLLDDLILECEQYTNMFTIELFLPFAFLNCDVFDMHKWMLDVGFGNTIAVSHKYPLVLRSYERTYEVKPKLRRRLRQAWESNWAICKKRRDAIALWLLKGKDYDKENLIVLLQEATCLAMTFIPPAFDATQPHIFTQMVSAGTSVALWPRPHDESLDEDTVEQAYQSLLVGYNFFKLPETIWERRRKASGDKKLLVNRLTLFWDDPYKLPSDAPDAPVSDKYPLVPPGKGK